MNQKDVDCLNKFHNYLLNNKTVITDEKLNRALDIYFFYQQILYNLNNNIQVSQENYDLFNQYFSTNSRAFSQTRLLFNQLIKERFDEVYNFYKRLILLKSNLDNCSIFIKSILFTFSFI